MSVAEKELIDNGILLSDFISSSTYGAIVKLIEDKNRSITELSVYATDQVAKFQDTEADGFVFCGKCGQPKL